MPDRTEDFWPKQFPTLSEPEPISLLKDQASRLGERTGGRILGFVKSSIEDGTAWYSLYLKAPALGDYLYKILNVAHPAVYDPALALTLTVQDAFGGDPRAVDGVREFPVWLKETLSSDKVAIAIATILRYLENRAAS